MLVCGLLNCALFSTFKESARSCSSYLSRILILRMTETLRPKNPGPLNTLRPMLPHTCPTGVAKLLLLNQGLPTLMPCRIVTGAICSAVCVLEGRFKLLFAVMVSGVPVLADRMPDTCHPPIILPAKFCA